MAYFCFTWKFIPFCGNLSNDITRGLIKRIHSILLIDNYDSFSYNLVEILRKIPAIDIAIVKNDDIAILENCYDAVIISPGPGLPYESGLLMKALELYLGNIPVLGICLGLQAIVEAYGGSLKQLPKVFHGIKDAIHILGESPILHTLPETFFAGRYHSWVASKKNLPSVIEVIAEDALGEIMAVQHVTDACYAVQFHPESYMTNEGDTIIRNFIALALKEKKVQS